MKITPDEVKRYRDMAAEWLADKKTTDILTGSDAWTVANQSGILRLAYQNPSITDAHIQTALEAIFPNAIFKNRKRY